MSPEALPLLLLWGTIVGLDLVSVSQTMIARPLVAATVAGAIVGDPVGGGVVGVILELFALEVLPVGGSRYPDYGLGGVAGAATLAGSPPATGTGLAVAVALAIAYVGGAGMRLVRTRNAADLRRHAAAIDGGRPRALAALQYRGLARDAARAVLVTGLGLAITVGVRAAPLPPAAGTLMTVAAVGAALATAASGTLRLSGRGMDLRWLAGGIAAGVVWMWLA